MAAEWLLQSTQAVMYTGANSAEVLTWVQATPGYTPMNTPVTILSEVSGVLTIRCVMYYGAYVQDVVINTGDWVVQSEGPGAPPLVIAGAAVGSSGQYLKKVNLSSTAASGIGYFTALLSNTINVDCVLRPTYPDLDYSVAGPRVITSLSVAWTGTINSVTNISGSIVRVSLTGSGILASGCVLVEAKRSNS